MAELRPVAGHSSSVQRHVRRVIVVVVAGLLVAIAKPWGNGVAPSTAGAPLPTLTPTATLAPSPSVPPAGRYDFLAFGTNEPPPGWELWPAGRLSSFTYAMRIDMAVSIVPAGGPASSGAPASGAPASGAAPTALPPTPSPTLSGTPSAADVPTDWPTVRVPRGSVLDLVGINRPRGYVVHVVGLTRVEDDGSSTPVRALLGASPWPDHFTTVGYAPQAGEDSMAPWPAGHYRLELTIDPGGARRILDIVVEGAATESASPASGPSPQAPEGSAAP